MTAFKDTYGILALVSSKDLIEDEDSVEREASLNQLDEALQTVKEIPKPLTLNNGPKFLH